MGTNYSADRSFTDIVHKKLALSKIYANLDWTETFFNPEFMKSEDIHNGIDYFFKNRDGETITTQERFRGYDYRQYNDFTIRFEREYNPHEERRMSEFYKIKADYFVYGIINQPKACVNSATDFEKFAVVDFKVVSQLLDEGLIFIDKSLPKVCVENNGRIACPIKYNHDYSSSFLPIDIVLLQKLFSDRNPIIYSKGY